MEYQIEHNEAASRFEIQIEGKLSLVDYIKQENVLVVTHTGVPAELEGRGIAAALTKALLEYVRKNNLKVKPVCPYTKAYIQKHVDYSDLVAE